MAESDVRESDVREQVRSRYARAAEAVTAAGGRTALQVVDADRCCAPGSATSAPTAGTDGDVVAANASCCGGSEVDAAFGSSLYSADEQGELPAEAVAASLGCGNPMAVADLKAGEKVLDLGSGGGIDVLLSARRVGPTGYAYGVDMTEEMLNLANANKAKAGVENVEFLKGTIEDVPLLDATVDVVISNCVINLSTGKPAVLAEMFRVLAPGGRIGISDVVAEDHLTPADRAERGSYVGCIAGALSRSEYLEGLAVVGFTGAEVTFTHEAAPGMHGAINQPAQGVFASMKAVEIRVRHLCDLGDDVIGVDLVNRAFGPGGLLTDPSAPEGEQEGTRALFAGAYAVLRNPAGHRQVDYQDVSEAAEAVQTASLLMRLLDRAERRLVAAGRGAAIRPSGVTPG